MPMSARPCLPLRAERGHAWDPIIHLHPLDECQHVGTLVGRQRLLVLAQHIGYLLKSETQFVRIYELGDQGDVLGGELVTEPDEEPVKESGNLLVVGAIHSGMLADASRGAHGTAALHAHGGRTFVPMCGPSVQSNRNDTSGWMARA